MPTHALYRPPYLSQILAICLSACVGTPTPEPPDNLPRLPRPDDTRVFAPIQLASDVSAPEALLPIPINGAPGAVAPNTELWIVNLDSAVAPEIVTAGAGGDFKATINGAFGDRVRLVSRTDTQHSPPLDAHVVLTSPGTFALGQLPYQGLSCLTITPEDELEAVVSSGADVTRSFALASHCAAAITVDAKLRFGDAGFSLTAPVSIPANGVAELQVRISGHDDPREHADVVLLDVRSDAGSGHYALGVWSISSASIGND